MVNRPESMIEGAMHGIYRAAADGRFIDANPGLAAMLGYDSVEELLKFGSTHTTFANQETRVRIADQCRRAGLVNDAEVVWTRRDRTPIRVRLSGGMVPSGGDDSTGHEVFVEDVTDRCRRDEQLCQLRKLAVVGQLAGGIAHNFNNLLTSILGFTEIVISQQEDGADDRALREIERAARRAAQLTRHLLAFSSTSPSGARDVRLGQSSGAICALMAPILRPNVTMAFHGPDVAATVRLEIDQIDEALFHLVLNAQNALPDGGRIDITVSVADRVPEGALPAPDGAPGPWVCVRVADDRGGLSTDVREHGLEPFFTTCEPDGIGLGLSAVYGIARRTGGCVTVESEVGKGTAVSLFLPAAPVRPGVLIVDDDEVVRAIAERILRARGYQVFTAASGEEAVELFGRERQGIGVLVTDLGLPQMSGSELARRLSTESPRLATVFVSGGAPTAALDVGRTGTILDKPFDAPGLVSAISRAIETSSARG
jgi:two-component system cell cycle sensor histidine kinase/response regulator CckA